MRVLALTPGDPNLASTRYRLGQFVTLLAAEGVTLEIMPLAEFRSWETLPSYDLVVIQKRLARLSWVRKVRSLAGKLVFDTDDAIWEPHGRKHSWWTRVRTNARVKAVALAADICTVPNEHLAAHLRGLGAKVAWVSMALDPAVWHPAVARSPGPVRIGWAGAPPNLIYLQRLENVLRQVLEQRPETAVEIYCGSRPNWTSALPYTFHEFSPGTEAEVTRRFDIGLLPLPDDAFAAGKSPIKALQYAACGLPCVASPVGATREIVEHGRTGLLATTEAEWTTSLLRLIDDESLRRSLGENALEKFRQDHSVARVQERMVACWKSVISG